MDDNVRKGVNVELPRGVYFIGDIGYALPDDIYYSFWIEGNNGKNGKYVTANGGIFAVSSTLYGDGGFPGSNGFIYGCDSGTIGIISKNLVRKSKDISKRFWKNDAGTFHNWSEPILFTELNGLFTFKEVQSGKILLQIETGDNDHPWT